MRLPAATEHQIQTAYFKRVRLAAKTDWRYRLIHSSGNGVHKTPQAANKANAAGQTRGVWDVNVPLPKMSANRPGYIINPGLWIEFKTEKELRSKGSGLSNEQLEFREMTTRTKHLTEVFCDPEIAFAFTKLYIDHCGVE